MSKIQYQNIKCPKCGEIIRGEIKHIRGFPFSSYYGYCEDCDYHITESEWEQV